MKRPTIGLVSIVVLAVLGYILSGVSAAQDLPFNPYDWGAWAATANNDQALELMLGRIAHDEIVNQRIEAGGFGGFKGQDASERAARQLLVSSNYVNPDSAWRARQLKKYWVNFWIANLKEKNAFALPGGNIYMTSGLWNAIKDDGDVVDEAAFVFGHEIAHLELKHTIQQVKKDYTFQISSWAAGKMGAKNDLLNIARSTHTIARFAKSRNQELEADRRAVQLMIKGDYNPQGAIHLLEKFKEEGGRTSCLLWCTHPDLDERIKAVRDEIEKVKS